MLINYLTLIEALIMCQKNVEVTLLALVGPPSQLRSNDEVIAFFV